MCEIAVAQDRASSVASNLRAMLHEPLSRPSVTKPSYNSLHVNRDDGAIFLADISVKKPGDRYKI